MEFSRTLASHYAQHRFAALFAVLLLTIAGHGLVGNLFPVENPLETLLGISLVAIVFSVPGGWLRWLLGGLSAGCVAARLTQGLLDPPAPPYVIQSLVAVVCALAAGVSVHRALGSGPVNAERICAALAAYLLAGIAFGAGYWLIEAALPGSFSFASADGFTPAHAVYFSFVVQATLGFGDIAPIREGAQGVVAAQGMGGQMYLAVLIARLVSLHSAREKP